MFSKTLEFKINKMFSELNNKALKISENSTTLKITTNRINDLVLSEISTRSKTMMSEMYTVLSKEVLDSLNNTSQRNNFYEANLRQELFDKYSSKIPNKRINIIEYNRLKLSMIISSIVMILGFLFVFILSPKSILIPNVLILVLSIGVFYVLYFKVIKEINKRKSSTAINNYMKQIKSEYIKWLNEVELYFNKRVIELKQKM